MEAGQLFGGNAGIRGKRREEMRRVVEADDGNAVLHAADQGVNDGIQFPVVSEVPPSGAPCFNDDRQRQRLRVSVLNESEILWYAVVGEAEVVSCESKDHLSCPGLHEDRRLHQSGAHRNGRLRRLCLLRSHG